MLISLFGDRCYRYVSCSECSYDSEACTCTSADRCYCSLGADHDVAAKLEATKKQQQQLQRESLMSCRTEDKCYCSMGGGGEVAESQTTWCDTDSCISTSKCYCRRNGEKGRKEQHKHHGHHTMHSSGCSNSDNNNNNNSNHNNNSCHLSSGSETNHNNNNNVCKKGKDSKSSKSRGNKMALDYELFTVSGSTRSKHQGSNAGKQVKAHEALSVKKSVEVAAMFADVKLSQTTDISTLVSSNGSRKSRGKLNNLSGGNNKDVSAKTEAMILHRERSLMKIRLGGKPEGHYQAVGGRTVSASLEDSLGYLP